MNKTPDANRRKSDRGRSPRDFYQTPIELADAALEYLIEKEKFWRNFRMVFGNQQLRVMDPGCGTGTWSQSASRRFMYTRLGLAQQHQYPLVHSIDIEPQITSEGPIQVIQKDYMDYEVATKYHLVVGNPPYSQAEDFIRKSMELIVERGYVYFLLQLNFLGSRRRQVGLFNEYRPKEIVVLTRRPSFFSVDNKPNSTDTINYAMFLWQKGHNLSTEINWLYWDYGEDK
jgi:23S rRNA U2552 (ribose-2'-O)-methylase RlmE/FtsJ